MLTTDDTCSEPSVCARETARSIGMDIAGQPLRDSCVLTVGAVVLLALSPLPGLPG